MMKAVSKLGTEGMYPNIRVIHNKPAANTLLNSESWKLKLSLQRLEWDENAHFHNFYSPQYCKS